MKKLTFIALAAFLSIAFLLPQTGCVEPFTSFTIQIPVNFQSEHPDRFAPDTSMDFINLNEYDEYQDNKDRISQANIKHFNYWINELQLSDGTWIDATMNDVVVFDFIRFYFLYGRPKDGSGNYDPLDSAYYEIDPTEDPILLGEFLDVDVAEYFRQAHHVEFVADSIAGIISEALRERPAFYIKTEYSKCSDQDIQTEPKRYFPFVGARYDLVIAITAEL